MHKPFLLNRLMLKIGLLILFIGYIAAFFDVQRFFPENNSHSDLAYIYDGTPPLEGPEPSAGDTMTYARFRQIEDRRHLIRSRQESTNMAIGGGIETKAIGIRLLNECDTCFNISSMNSLPSPSYYLVLPGYYLDAQVYCYSWDGRNYMKYPVAGHDQVAGHYQIREVPFLYSFSHYTQRDSDKKGSILIPISKTAYDILLPVILVIVIASSLFLLWVYTFFPWYILLRISDGHAFSDRNIRQLKWLGWALVAPTFIMLALKQGRYLQKEQELTI